MAAYKQAVDLGCDMLELDVNLSKVILTSNIDVQELDVNLSIVIKRKYQDIDIIDIFFQDGQAVVAHDNNLLRLTGEKMLITETEFVNLPQIQEKVQK